MVAGGQGRLDAFDRPGRVGEPEARLVEDEVVDVAGQSGAAHGAVGAVGVAPQGDRATGAGGDGVDDGGDVVEVALDGVGRGVAAGAEAAAVHGEGGQVVAQHGDERVEGGVVGDGAVHQHDGRTVAVDPHGERGAVGRADVEPVGCQLGDAVAGHRWSFRHAEGIGARRSSSAANTDTALAKSSGCSA